jgi:hypothetical protein
VLVGPVGDLDVVQRQVEDALETVVGGLQVKGRKWKPDAGSWFRPKLTRLRRCFGD